MKFLLVITSFLSTLLHIIISAISLYLSISIFLLCCTVSFPSQLVSLFLDILQFSGNVNYSIFFQFSLLLCYIEDSFLCCFFLGRSVLEDTPPDLLTQPNKGKKKAVVVKAYRFDYVRKSDISQPVIEINKFTLSVPSIH